MKLNIFCCFFGNVEETEKELKESIEHTSSKLTWQDFVKEPIPAKDPKVVTEVWVSTLKKK